MSEVCCQAFRQLCQVIPLFARPVVQQLHPRLGNGFERLLDFYIFRTIEAARPPHAELAGFAEPGQPAPLAR
ncbi:hypothetical protein D3C79_698960 [compost metagenome]